MIAKFKIYAGSTSEGSVCYYVEHPLDSEIYVRTYHLDEVQRFLDQNNLEMNADFRERITKYLKMSFRDNKGVIVGSNMIIPLDKIDENRPISSASDFLKKYFPEYY
jgi:hypothetical protein